MIDSPGPPPPPRLRHSLLGHHCARRFHSVREEWGHLRYNPSRGMRTWATRLLLRDPGRLEGAWRGGGSRPALSTSQGVAYAGTVFDLTGAAASHLAVVMALSSGGSNHITGLAVASWALVRQVAATSRRLTHPQSERFC